MCQDCVKEEYPDRGNMCLEEGSYFQNFVACASCRGRDVLVVQNRDCSEDSEGVENITYDHVCKVCHHVVASHLCTFRVEDQFQEYEMTCLLCGNAEDSRSVMPCDPRQQPLYL